MIYVLTERRRMAEVDLIHERISPRDPFVKLITHEEQLYGRQPGFYVGLHDNARLDLTARAGRHMRVPLKWVRIILTFLNKGRPVEEIRKLVEEQHNGQAV